MRTFFIAFVMLAGNYKISAQNATAYINRDSLLRLMPEQKEAWAKTKDFAYQIANQIRRLDSTLQIMLEKEKIDDSVQVELRTKVANYKKRADIEFEALVKSSREAGKERLDKAINDVLKERRYLNFVERQPEQNPYENLTADVKKKLNIE